MGENKAYVLRVNKVIYGFFFSQIKVFPMSNSV